MSRRMITRVTLVTTLSLGVMTLAACGSGGGPSSSGNGSNCEVPSQNVDDSAFSGDVSGEITFQTTNLKKDFSGFFNGVIADFEKNYPQVKVTWIDDPGDADFGARMLAQARACNLPDVLNVNMGNLGALNQANQLIDFEKKTPGAGDTYVPSIWTSIRSESNAAYPGLPWYWSPQVVTYNKDLFAQAGLDAKNPPRNLEELFTAAQAIGQKSGGNYFALRACLRWRV